MIVPFFPLELGLLATQLFLETVTLGVLMLYLLGME